MEDQNVNNESTGQADNQWEMRIKGLQTALNRKEEELRKAIAQGEAYKAELGASKGILAELEAQVRALENERSELAKAREELQAEVARRQKELSRVSKLAAHPELLDHERQGLLRTDLDPESEDFDQYLKRYLDVISGKVSKAIQDTLQGAIPQVSAPKESQKVSKDDLMDQMRMAILSGDLSTYESLRQALLKGD